jgi:hypothetical protein
MKKERIRKLIFHVLSAIKQSDEMYHTLELNDETIILGPTSAFDSVVFTAFAADLEEKIEQETGSAFELNVERIFENHVGEQTIQVKHLADSIFSSLSAEK